MVTRSSDLAASKTTPATSFPISDVESEHCRSVAAQKLGATPTSLYRVSGVAPVSGGATRVSMPESAGSGSGSDGEQMLFRSPTRPAWPALQSPTSPPMSPMPGTEHRLSDTAGPAGAVAVATD